MSKFVHYQVFTKIVEEGSISLAAAKLNLSAAAVSKQLVQLEQHLKVQLFYRSHKKLDITDAGKRFYPKCKAILHSVAQAEEDLLSEREAISGTLSVTLSKALCRSGIMGVLASFEDKYPLIRFNIHFSDDLEDLHSSNIDFAFRLGKLRDSSHMVATPLLDTQLVACATPGYLQKHGYPRQFSDPGSAKLILMPYLRASTELRKFLKKEGINSSSSTAHTINDIEGIYQAVSAGLGIGMLLDISVQQEISSGVFQTISANSKLPKKRLYLLAKKDHWQTKKHRAFKDHVKAALRR